MPKKPSFIETHITDLQKQQQAMLAEKVIECLSNKGYTFDSEHDMHQFFKNRVKSTVQGAVTILFLDDETGICQYKTPVFKPVKGGTKERQDVSIMFEFKEL